MPVYARMEKRRLRVQEWMSDISDVTLQAGMFMYYYIYIVFSGKAHKN